MRRDLTALLTISMAMLASPSWGQLPSSSTPQGTSGSPAANANPRASERALQRLQESIPRAMADRVRQSSTSPSSSVAGRGSLGQRLTQRLARFRGDTRTSAAPAAQPSPTRGFAALGQRGGTAGLPAPEQRGRLFRERLANLEQRRDEAMRAGDLTRLQQLDQMETQLRQETDAALGRWSRPSGVAATAGLQPEDRVENRGSVVKQWATSLRERLLGRTNPPASPVAAEHSQVGPRFSAPTAETPLVRRPEDGVPGDLEVSLGFPGQRMQYDQPPGSQPDGREPNSLTDGTRNNPGRMNYPGAASGLPQANGYYIGDGRSDSATSHARNQGQTGGRILYPGSNLTDYGYGTGGDSPSVYPKPNGPDGQPGPTGGIAPPMSPRGGNSNRGPRNPAAPSTRVETGVGRG